jgi:ATP-dependent Zn protease
MSKRSTAYHEAAHAVAAYFHPLAGKTQRICISGDDLTEYNLLKHPTNEAAGIHRRGRILPAIVGRSVDREQVHDMCILLLSGYAAGWVYAGEDRSSSKFNKRDQEEALKNADGSDDFVRCWGLLEDSDPFDIPDALRGVREKSVTKSATADELFERGRKAIDDHHARILDLLEVLWREAAAFVVAKWPHIQAVADAVFRKKTLEGSEVVELIERVEKRLQSYPPHVQELLDQLRA